MRGCGHFLLYLASLGLSFPLCQMQICNFLIPLDDYED